MASWLSQHRVNRLTEYPGLIRDLLSASTHRARKKIERIFRAIGEKHEGVRLGVFGGTVRESLRSSAALRRYIHQEGPEWQSNKALPEDLFVDPEHDIDVWVDPEKVDLVKEELTKQTDQHWVWTSFQTYQGNTVWRGQYFFGGLVFPKNYLQLDLVQRTPKETRLADFSCNQLQINTNPEELVLVHKWTPANFVRSGAFALRYSEQAIIMQIIQDIKVKETHVLVLSLENWLAGEPVDAKKMIEYQTYLTHIFSKRMRKVAKYGWKVVNLVDATHSDTEYILDCGCRRKIDSFQNEQNLRVERGRVVVNCCRRELTLALVIDRK